MKIYSDDPLVKYKSSTVSPDRTRDEISAVLRQYDVADIHWHWKPDANDVFVQFGIEEVIDGTPVKVMVKVICPTIWDKAIRNSPKPERRVETPNLRVGMRAMYHYIYTHLNSAYAMQSSKVAGFLSDMVTPTGQRYFDALKSKLNEYQALDYVPEPAERNVETVKHEPKKVIIDQ